jgi:hypothetical protein
MLSTLSVINLAYAMAIFESLNRMFLSYLFQKQTFQRPAIGFDWLISWTQLRFSRKTLRFHPKASRFPEKASPSRLYALSCRAIFTVIVCLFGLCLLPAVSLADATSTAPTEILEPERSDIAAEKIDQFAQAYLQVLTLLSDREPELPAAETSAEALKIQQSIKAAA